MRVLLVLLCFLILNSCTYKKSGDCIGLPNSYQVGKIVEEQRYGVLIKFTNEPRFTYRTYSELETYQKIDCNVLDSDIIVR